MGWRQRIEQAYRFEAALEVIRGTGGTVLDVGCGVGALFDYARLSGIHASFVGIEPYEPLARRARTRHTVLGGRFEDVPSPVGVGCAVAIGTLAGSSSRIVDLVAFMSRAPALCLIVLDRDAVAARPAFAEHHATAVGAEELEALRADLGPHARVVRISPTDLALVRTPQSSPSMCDVPTRFARTVQGPWGLNESPECKAWLACELGLHDEAQAWLAQIDHSSDFVALVRARFDRLQTDSSAIAGAAD